MSDVPVPVTAEEPPAPPEPPREPSPPIRSRFLFVDVSAQRAKQLRRGARPRVDAPEIHKLERLAMREVKNGTVDWNLPAFRGAPADITP
jgi:DNA-directed RNA polymerase omega subunit